MITLKVVLKDGFYFPDTKHFYGGIDTKQVLMFNHLFPEGCVSDCLGEELYGLAEAHGWKVEARKI